MTGSTQAVAHTLSPGPIRLPPGSYLEPVEELPSDSDSEDFDENDIEHSASDIGLSNIEEEEGEDFEEEDGSLRERDPVFEKIKETLSKTQRSESVGSILSSDSNDSDGPHVQISEHYTSLPYGIQPKATYEHSSLHADIMGVAYNGRMRQFVILDSKGITTWKRDLVDPRVRRALQFPKYEYCLIRHIVFVSKYNCYFALGKDFSVKPLSEEPSDLESSNFIKIFPMTQGSTMFLGMHWSKIKVLNRDFEETCSVNTNMRSVLFILFNHVRDELITGGVGGIKIWNFVQAAGKAFTELKPLANYELRLKESLPNVGGSWVKRVDLDYQLQHLYCCSDTDLHVYDLSGKLLFKFERAHTMSITGCCFSPSAKTLITSSVDSEAKMEVSDVTLRLGVFLNDRVDWKMPWKQRGLLTIKVWSLTGGLVHTFRGHSRAVTALMLHPETSTIIMTASLDGSIRMWSLDTMDLLYMIVVSADGVMWMGLTDDKLLYISTCRNITLWNLNTFYSFWALARSQVTTMWLASSEEKTTKVLAVGDDNSVRIFNRSNKKNMTTVLPPPDISPLQKVLSLCYSREKNAAFLLVTNKEIWVYTTRTDPSCRIAVWDVHELQLPYISGDATNLPPGVTIQPPSQSMSTHRATCNGHGNEIISNCCSLCVLNSTAMMWTDEGLCCPLRHTYLLLGMEDGRILFMDPVVRGQKYMEFKASKDAIREMKHDKEHSSLVTLCRLKTLVLIQIWGLPQLDLLYELYCGPDVTCYGRVGLSLLTGHTSGQINYHMLEPAEDLGILKSKQEPSFENIVDENRRPEHQSAVVAMDCLANLRLFVTCSADGAIKVWDEAKVLMTEVMLEESLSAACFLNDMGDLLVGFKNHVFYIDHTKLCPAIKPEEIEMETSDQESDVYEDPRVLYELIKDDEEAITLQNYLVPYDLEFDKDFLEGKTKIEQPKTAAEAAAAEESETETETDISLAPSSIYLSPADSIESLSMIDLTLGANYSKYDLRDQMKATLDMVAKANQPEKWKGLAPARRWLKLRRLQIANAKISKYVRKRKQRGKKKRKHVTIEAFGQSDLEEKETEVEMEKFSLPAFGNSPGGSPSITPPSGQVSPRSRHREGSEEEYSDDERKPKAPRRLPEGFVPVQPDKAEPEVQLDEQSATSYNESSISKIQSDLQSPSAHLTKHSKTSHHHKHTKRLVTSSKHTSTSQQSTAQSAKLPTVEDKSKSVLASCIDTETANKASTGSSVKQSKASKQFQNQTPERYADDKLSNQTFKVDVTKPLSTEEKTKKNLSNDAQKLGSLPKVQKSVSNHVSFNLDKASSLMNKNNIVSTQSSAINSKTNKSHNESISQPSTVSKTTQPQKFGFSKVMNHNRLTLQIGNNSNALKSVTSPSLKSPDKSILKSPGKNGRESAFPKPIEDSGNCVNVIASPLQSSGSSMKQSSEFALVLLNMVDDLSDEETKESNDKENVSKQNKEEPPDVIDRDAAISDKDSALTTSITSESVKLDDQVSLVSTVISDSEKDAKDSEAVRPSQNQNDLASNQAQVLTESVPNHLKNEHESINDQPNNIIKSSTNSKVDTDLSTIDSDSDTSTTESSSGSTDTLSPTQSIKAEGDTSDIFNKDGTPASKLEKPKPVMGDEPETEVTGGRRLKGVKVDVRGLMKKRRITSARAPSLTRRSSTDHSHDDHDHDHDHDHGHDNHRDHKKKQQQPIDRRLQQKMDKNKLMNLPPNPPSMLSRKRSLSEQRKSLEFNLIHRPDLRAQHELDPEKMPHIRMEGDPDIDQLQEAQWAKEAGIHGTTLTLPPQRDKNQARQVDRPDRSQKGRERKFTLGNKDTPGVGSSPTGELEGGFNFGEQEDGQDKVPEEQVEKEDGVDFGSNLDTNQPETQMHRDKRLGHKVDADKVFETDKADKDAGLPKVSVKQQKTLKVYIPQAERDSTPSRSSYRGSPDSGIDDLQSVTSHLPQPPIVTISQEEDKKLLEDDISLKDLTDEERVTTLTRPATSFTGLRRDQLEGEKLKADRPRTAHVRFKAEDLQTAFEEALKKYQNLPGTPKVVSAETLYRNDGVNFEDNWQERAIERHTLLRMQKEIRAQSAAQRRQAIEMIKNDKNSSKLFTTRCHSAAPQTTSDHSTTPTGYRRANTSLSVPISFGYGVNSAPPPTRDKQRPKTANPVILKQQAIKNELSQEKAYRYKINKQGITTSRPSSSKSISTVADFSPHWIDPRNPSAWRPKSSRSIPSKCNRYVLVNKPREKQSDPIPSPLEEQLLIERFPKMGARVVPHSEFTPRLKKTYPLEYSPFVYHRLV